MDLYSKQISLKLSQNQIMNLFSRLFKITSNTRYDENITEQYSHNIGFRTVKSICEKIQYK